jgi:hypothetical protein
MVTFQGLKSVRDRTLFTFKGPIVKRPLDLLTGSDLQIISETEVYIPTGSFSSLNVGQQIEITGTPSGRNDGLFSILEAITSNRLKLDNVNFDISDVAQTTDKIVALANDLKSRYEFHRVQTVTIGTDIEGVHGTDDIINIITAPAATNLSSAITLLNDIRTQLNAHVIDVSGTPPVHNSLDALSIVEAIQATNLPSALLLVNDIRKKYENHRQNRFIHQNADTINRVIVNAAVVVTGVYPGPLTGPFSWILKDPRYGTAADDPTDVEVFVNGSQVTVDAVFGPVGAVVLTNKPNGTDIVTINYDYINNPPARLLRFNYPEFGLNQYGNKGVGGFPHHRYRIRSYIIDPSNTPDFISAVQPKRIGWKYKGIEREYSAVLNDPNRLLYNVPTNKIKYPVLFEQIPEVTISYDPNTLPENAHDPWVLNGEGEISLLSNSLVIRDLDVQFGPDSQPPFYSHEINIKSDSNTYTAFRALVSDDSLLQLDGVFTGVSFGISDGLKAAIVGFIITEATNLTSAISLVNSIKSKFNTHIVTTGVHNPNDTDDTIIIVDATDLTSLIILANEIKSKFGTHISKGGGIGLVHQNIDTVNIVSSSNATDLNGAILLINELRIDFNAHIVQSGIHFIDDTLNDVELVKQVGILNNSNFSEFQDAWNAFAIDWTEFKTYRVVRDLNGDIKLFLSGDTEPSATATLSELPALSDMDGKFDPVQQVFFGSIERDATNESIWQFIRINISPIDANLIEDNKSITYDASIVPEKDSVSPWITIGQGGVERILTGDVLSLDSTSSIFTDDPSPYGLTSGCYRGFIRFEPIITRDTTVSLEFRTAIDYYTFGIDNQACGVYIDDKSLSVQFVFLQYSPSPATVLGSTTEPFTIIAGDQLIIQIQSGPLTIITFGATDTTAANVAATINTVVGFTFATDEGGHLRLTSQSEGSNAQFNIVGGSAVVKLGLTIGTYIGLDSNPEPRVSWFGSNLPDFDEPVWDRGGSESATMLGRTMRLTDTSTSDYILFGQNNALINNQVLDPSSDWKLNFRLNIRTFQAGDIIPTVAPYSDLNFAGAFVSIDEGLTGKNVEIHYSVDGSGNPFLNLLSFNAVTGALDVISQYAFNWNDGFPHTINIYTSKVANLIIVLADGVALSPSAGPSPTYTGLNSGVVGPSITFGSGTEPVTGSDLRSSLSVVDWYTLAIFKDSKINDALASSRRYIGIYKGGAPELLSSYYLYQIDWTALHTYRIVRDPTTAVSVYIDGSATPVLTTAYDIISLPPSTSSFLKEITNDDSVIAFGSFNPKEISRSRWDFVNYSIGKITLTERLVPPKHVLNQANIITSPDHLFTQKTHTHFEFKVYSGGTPIDEFMADEEVQAFTELGESTAPVPMTQDLESRGGFVKVGTPADMILVTDFVNTKGHLTDLDDDTINSITTASVLAQVIALANDLRTKYEAHRQNIIHSSIDVVNIITAPVANDLTTVITLLNNIKVNFNAHRTQVTVHFSNDITNIVTAANAIDIGTAVSLVNDIRTQYEAHRQSAIYHSSSDNTNSIEVDPADNAVDNFVALSNEIKEKYLLHVEQYRVHLANDIENIDLADDATDQSSAIILANSEKEQINIHLSATIREIQKVHSLDDGINVIIAPDATDSDSLAVLLDDIRSKYEAHRIEPGVHGSTLFIRIEPPSRVLYNGMKFWQFESGEAGLVAPFSDDETLHLDTIGLQQSASIFYGGSVLPEDVDELDVQNLANDLRTMYEAHRIEPGVHSSNDTINVITAAVATNLATTIVLLIDIRDKLNAHLIESGVHLVDDPRNTSTNLDPTEVKTAISLANELKLKYERHRLNELVAAHIIIDNTNYITVDYAPPVADPGWIRVDNGIGSPTLSLHTSGPTDFLRYSVIGSQLTTYYYKNTGLTSQTSLNFELTVRMRVNSFYYNPNVDTSIYAGFSSPIGPGILAGIGFESLNNIPYVKIQDLGANIPVYEAPFDWADGNFHTFRLVRDVKSNTVGLVFDG